MDGEHVRKAFYTHGAAPSRLQVSNHLFLSSKELKLGIENPLDVMEGPLAEVHELRTGYRTWVELRRAILISKLEAQVKPVGLSADKYILILALIPAQSGVRLIVSSPSATETYGFPDRLIGKEGRVNRRILNPLGRKR